MSHSTTFNLDRDAQEDLTRVEGPVSFVDPPGNRREGQAYLKPVQMVMNGVAFGRPYQQPFSVR
jgi:hypothetical protein